MGDYNMAKFQCNFISYTLKRAVDVTVIIPSETFPEAVEMLQSKEQPRHKKTDKYPVLYLLHGYGNNHATWTAYTNVEMYAEEQKMAVVMPSAENKFYINHGKEDLFFDFIEQELPDFVCGMFPVSERKEDTYLAGLSMGGYGTLLHGLSNPEKYAALGAFSAAVMLKDDMPDPLEIAKEQVKKGKALPKIYLACGKKDFLYEDNLTFRDEMKALGADITWEEHPDYGHEWRFWDLQVEAFLNWIKRSDAFAIGKKWML